jgi:hypothetical protein
MDKFNWVLNSQDETLLLSIKDDIKTLNLTIAHSLIKQLHNKNFGYFYLGILSAKNDKIDLALALLGVCRT